MLGPVLWLSVDTRTTIMQIAVASVLAAQMLFTWTHARAEPVPWRKGFADCAAMLIAFLTGVAMYGVIDTDFAAVDYRKGELFLEPDYSIAFVILQALSSGMMWLVLLFSVQRFQEFPDTIVSKKEKQTYLWGFVSLTVGSGIAIFSVAFSSAISSSHQAIQIMMCTADRMAVAGGFFLLTLTIAQSPPFIFNVRGNVNRLLDTGVVGWLLVAMTEMGPSCMTNSVDFWEKHDITHKQSESFGVVSLSAVGVGHSYREAVFLLPFPKHEDLIAVCVSFSHKDLRMKDTRTAGRTLNVFSIIIPTNLVEYIRTPTHASDIIRNYTTKYGTVTLLSEPSVMQELAATILSEVI